MFRFRRASVLRRTHAKATDNIFTQVPYRKRRHCVGPYAVKRSNDSIPSWWFCVKSRRSSETGERCSRLPSERFHRTAALRLRDVSVVKRIFAPYRSASHSCNPDHQTEFIVSD